MHLRLSQYPLIDAAAIRDRIAAMAAELDARYAGREPLVLVVLKGAAPFSVDLMRAMRAPVSVDYIRAKSYDGTASRGEVVFSHLPEEPLRDRHVLVLEDILDTGQTATAILDFVRAQHPASRCLATLLDKPSRRTCAINADLAGFVIPDHFVVGYGLDYNERYRELDAIYTLES